MLFTNARVFRGNEGFVEGGFEVEEGRFTRVLAGQLAGGVDLGGAKVIPGLVDIHIHGAMGSDVSDGDYEGLCRMAGYLASRGITSFAPTSMTLPYDILSRAFANARRLKEEAPRGCARPLGIHMEGPFFSEKKKGAQNGAYLQKPDFDAFLALYEGCDGFICQVDVAPELEGAAEFTRRASRLVTVSVAHTDADYPQTRELYEAGATHLTHLFNAMPPIHHRHPGVIGAASEREDVFGEVIADGHHVHPSSLRMAFKLFPGRICLISDALRCCGMPEGDYELGGQPIVLSGGVARLTDGTLAGAAADLMTDLQNVIRFGIPEQEAILAATLNPARSLKMEGEVGSIEAGRWADFLLIDNDWNLKQVYVKGEAV